MHKFLGLIYIGNEGSYSDMKFTIKTGEAVITEAGHASNVFGDFPDKFQLISAEDCELILSNGTVTVNAPYPFYNQLEDFDVTTVEFYSEEEDEEDEDTAEDKVSVGAETSTDTTAVDEPDCETQ